MAVYRIRLAKDKGELVKRLVESDEDNAPFETYADVVMFAASLGYQRHQAIPLDDVIAKEPAPIAWDVFRSRGYDRTIRLLAIATTEEVSVLSLSSPEAIAQQIQILEEYANGGLQILQEELRGIIDITHHLPLMLHKQRHPQESPPEFDLSQFL
ncbi:DNA phosphorothioation-associated protein 4 [Roseofilum sp. BLCC_M154]|uniref:DNA phosphorothioation-associated protein 4 n=1 Tax=Roseofilum acuticapitatum BLCC-M154 TaxID=3022444 RepID=A0ABT7APL5_9CYAN|nr:DNA phosphorothioation-associated protein 4 [Roseofilum acuticapitatum]MDJ1168547.1 DNA phosphorothioation-associated protein 4 [Roseofilum acuticapitatum BLCC-M154]